MTVPLLGYADRLSVAPGEAVRLMVSADVPAYEAQLVRLRHGDDRPPGPGYREYELDSPINGTYAGRRQEAWAGSFGVVPSGDALGRLEAVTLQAWIYPTTPDRAALQGILGKWAEVDGRGFLLCIQDGKLGVWLGRGSASEPVFVSHPGTPDRGAVAFRGGQLRRKPGPAAAGAAAPRPLGPG